VAARSRIKPPADPPDRGSGTPAARALGQDRVPRGLAIAIMVLILVGAALIRLRLADVPLERDEGEYALAGQLILQGVPPYQLVYNMKFPGTYYAYSLLLALFGQSARGIHVGLLLVNAATTWLLFRLARRVTGEHAALVAAAAFAVLSLDRWIMGVFAHATQFVILTVVAGFLVLDRAMETKQPWRFVAAGVLLGSSVLMKQHAGAFVVFALAWILGRDRRNFRPAAALTLGVLVPFAIVCAVLAVQGVFGRFWFWTIDYARAYVSEVPLSGALPALVVGLRTITTATWALWLVAALGLFGLWLAPWPRATRVLAAGFLLASFLTTCPGFYFRAHYFIAMLPAVALLAGVGVVSLERMLAARVGPRVAGTVAAGLFLAALLAYVLPERGYLFSMTPDQVSRERYCRNLFVEAPAIGRYIQQRTTANDRVAVIGSEPEVYFYAKRKSATGYVYMYPLMEDQPLAQRMQDEMMREIENAHPAVVVFVASRTSWLPRPGGDRRVLTWANRYLGRCYDVAGIAERLPDGSSALRWGAETTDYRPQSENVVYTLTRRSDSPCAPADPPAR